mmetsp:Transcript_16453/g.40519  ORF Transcript_16453/g.40519 Transcript_16453/m.40519 type:complete len:326 (+) Transcript_16453:315-1292(+)|eukprot:CAMPEP_0114497716 /NCGR_PEP_ID=MMETSP0109-20121206/6481_1 /TAXON_ID=29199 /ORGANISM="Chlorarachnion reptans, Strain CCCM449" /LENGTH=325 /DNA_ID=CAMNT_0001675133 /DNA_START=229 /DNA_END=1206 /DNA_ORIENTATION=+
MTVETDIRQEVGVETAALEGKTTEELKQTLLNLVEGRNKDGMKDKVTFYRESMEPVIEELSKRNPNPNPEDQVPLVQGSWTPVWSTIPFQDSLPGRVLDESYQIFQDNGYYANIARYAPGSNMKVGWGVRLASFLLALDLLILQKYSVVNNEWYIENVAIKQSLRWSGAPLTMEKANEWFSEILPEEQRKLKVPQLASEKPNMGSTGFVDRSSMKKLDTAFKSKPTLEHLYIDDEFRVVKTRREANQRASYTIAVRRDRGAKFYKSQARSATSVGAYLPQSNTRRLNGPSQASRSLQALAHQRASIGCGNGFGFSNTRARATLRG